MHNPSILIKMWLKLHKKEILKDLMQALKRFRFEIQILFDTSVVATREGVAKLDQTFDTAKDKGVAA